MSPVETVPFVDLKKQYQSLKTEIDQAIARVIERTDFILGDEVEAFEATFADYCEAQHAVGLNSGAAGLELALRALEIGPGDEVLVPANTFFATASAVSFAGATPVFVDVDPRTYNIDVTQLEAKITPRTKAIMPVHLYGCPAEMDAIMTVAARRGLYVIEDACQAHGARYKGRRVGAIGHVGAFSFYPAKNLGAYGDGGAIVTNDADLAERIRMLRNCGQREKYRHEMLGGNHRLDTIQAAVLRVKLHHLDQWNDQRRRLAQVYNAILDDLGVRRPVVDSHLEHVYHLYVIQVNARDGLRQHLTEQGIHTGVHYPIPVHRQPVYADQAQSKGSFPVTEISASRLLSLPMFPELTVPQVERVCACIAEFLHASSGSSECSFAPEPIASDQKAEQVAA